MLKLRGVGARESKGWHTETTHGRGTSREWIWVEKGWIGGGVHSDVHPYVYKTTSSKAQKKDRKGEM